MWKCMAPTGAFGEIYRPRDSDRRSLFFMLSGLKKRKERGSGCGSGARGRRCACSPPGLDVVLMRLGGACQALLTKVAFKGFNPLEKRGRGSCCTYIRTCESGKWFLGKKRGQLHPLIRYPVGSSGSQHPILGIHEEMNFVSHVKRLIEPLF